MENPLRIWFGRKEIPERKGMNSAGDGSQGLEAQWEYGKLVLGRRINMAEGREIRPKGYNEPTIERNEHRKYALDDLSYRLHQRFLVKRRSAK